MNGTVAKKLLYSILTEFLRAYLGCFFLEYLCNYGIMFPNIPKQEANVIRLSVHGCLDF